MWCGILFAASLASAVTWHLSDAYGQQRGQGRGMAGGMAGGAGGGGGMAGGAMGGGPGGMGGGMGGGPGGMGGGFGPPTPPASVAASGDYVYVVQNDTLYQLSADGLVLANQIQLPPAGKAGGAKARK
jgi:hypothetical protein